ncbi:unnamed protein product [Ixodes hexagonus]
MAQFVDSFSQRMLGSATLEKSIDHLVAQLRLERFQDVRTEDVLAVRWQRQREVALLVSPERQPLKILGLGGSIGTPPGGVTASLSIVTSFSDLDVKDVSVPDVGHSEIILDFAFNFDFTQVVGQSTRHGKTIDTTLDLIFVSKELSNYDVSVYDGLSDHDLVSLTCHLNVNDTSKKIPEKFVRNFERASDVQIFLQLEPGDPQQVVSRNIVVDWIGTKYPKEYILLGAHIDSWDIGQGAADNAAAVFIIWRALSVLKKLELKPKRTVRFVVWTAREQGMEGATEFYRRHASDSGRLSFALELDMAAFAPLGLALSDVKNNDTLCIVREMLKEFEPIGANQLLKGGNAAQLRHWRLAGVPVAGLVTAWFYHEEMRHSEADTVSGINAADLDSSAAMVAGLVHMVGQMERRLPR